MMLKTNTKFEIEIPYMHLNRVIEFFNSNYIGKRIADFNVEQYKGVLSGMHPYRMYIISFEISEMGHPGHIVELYSEIATFLGSLK